MAEKIYTEIRDGCTETYSEHWLRNNQLLRCGNLNSASGYDPFYSALFPRYGSETVRRNIPAWFRFQNAAEMTVELLLDGVMRYTQGNITEEVRPGELYIIHKGSDTRFEQLPGEHFHRLRLMFCGNLVIPLTLSLQLAGKRVIPLRDPDSTAAQFGKIIDLLCIHAPDAGAEISSRGYALLTAIAAESEGYRKKLPPLVERLLSDLSSDLVCRHSVADFARRHGCGVHTLMRLFRKHLGIPPAAYREQLRFEQACQLLRTTRLPIKEISDRLGYCDQLYFSAAFRKRAGMPPTVYRRCRSESNWE
ncbi:MAG: helix-turn-helix transcriptional regulator [Lentisphaeria bacterium]|nr:helix-turn-helix transcriptional regulator [Lentisphaeria bacterium]